MTIEVEAIAAAMWDQDEMQDREHDDPPPVPWPPDDASLAEFYRSSAARFIPYLLARLTLP